MSSVTAPIMKEAPESSPWGHFRGEAKEQLLYTESLIPCLPLNQKQVLRLPGLLEPHLLTLHP